MNAEIRLEKTNQLIICIGSCGHRFFNHKNKNSYLELDARGRIWFIDSYSKKRIYTHYSGTWRGFTNGGTLRSLIDSLCRYIKHNQLLSPNHFYWADYICNGDLWGYGKDMEIVRAKVKELALIQ